jgi:hypothetical protein
MSEPMKLSEVAELLRSVAEFDRRKGHHSYADDAEQAALAVEQAQGALEVLAGKVIAQTGRTHPFSAGVLTVEGLIAYALAEAARRREDKPPQFFEIPPIDITGGQDAADYVAGLREDE